jgi:hypothetical protein
LTETRQVVILSEPAEFAAPLLRGKRNSGGEPKDLHLFCSASKFSEIQAARRSRAEWLCPVSADVELRTSAPHAKP